MGFASRVLVWQVLVRVQVRVQIPVLLVDAARVRVRGLVECSKRVRMRMWCERDNGVSLPGYSRIRYVLCAMLNRVSSVILTALRIPVNRWSRRGPTSRVASITARGARESKTYHVGRRGPRGGGVTNDRVARALGAR